MIKKRSLTTLHGGVLIYNNHLNVPMINSVKIHIEEKQNKTPNENFKCVIKQNPSKSLQKLYQRSISTLKSNQLIKNQFTNYDILTNQVNMCEDKINKQSLSRIKIKDQGSKYSTKYRAKEPTKQSLQLKFSFNPIRYNEQIRKNSKAKEEQNIIFKQNINVTQKHRKNGINNRDKQVAYLNQTEYEKSKMPQKASANLNIYNENLSQIANQQSIKVYVRFKPQKQLIFEGVSMSLSSQIYNQSPLNSRVSINSQIKLINQQVICLEDKIFAFDRLFKHQTQAHIFQQIASPILQKLFLGFNGTIFAYGQTGSGKTYTIFGDLDNQIESGIIPRSINYIFQKINHLADENIKIKYSLVQIYKEELYDMLYIQDSNERQKKPQLKLKQNKEKGVYIDKLTQIQTINRVQLFSKILQALKSRRISSTKINEKSSRSHTILTLTLCFKNHSTKISLIDLAGSQKVRKSGVTGQSLEQTKKINYSLSCLGNVINALTTRSNNDHIPFRDSKLTRILKDSLTGSFLTSIIVNCHSGRDFINENISSLKFAERAKRVKIQPKNKISLQKMQSIMQSEQNTSRICSSIQYYQTKIKQLSSELLYTKAQLQNYKAKQVSNEIFLQNNSQQQSCISTRSHHFYFNESNKFLECQGDLTARLPIPSQRALVFERISKYAQKQVITLNLGSKHQGESLDLKLNYYHRKCCQNQSGELYQKSKNNLQESSERVNESQIMFSQRSQQICQESNESLLMTEQRGQFQKVGKVKQMDQQSEISFSFSAYREQDLVTDRKLVSSKSTKRSIR